MTMPAMPLVFVVIVNWNGRDDLLACLDSLGNIDYPKENLKLLVVDNGSSDGSQDTVRKKWPGVLLIENGRNLGYAAAANQGIEEAVRSGADYAWIFNNDVIIEEGTLRRMVLVGESDEKIGVVAPVIYAFDDPRKVENAGYKINFWIGWLKRLKLGVDVLQDSDVSDVDSVMGCSNLVKAPVFKKIGFLRPVYGVYFEETDFNVRAARAGFRVVIVRAARVWHRNASTMNKFLFRRAYLLLRNLFLFELYNARPLHLAVFFPYYFLVHLPYFLLRGSMYGFRMKLKNISRKTK